MYLFNQGRLRGDSAAELDERLTRTRELYRYDVDSSMHDGSTDEEDRILLDDFDPK